MYNPTFIWLLRVAFGKKAESVFRLYPQDGAEVPEPDQGSDIEVVSPAGDPRLPAGHSAFYRWFIDAGHGRFTEGKRSPIMSIMVHIITRQWRLLEWEYNRDIAERVGEQLTALNLIWERTLPVHGDYGNALIERVSAANNFPKDSHKPLFVSLHGNAGPAPNLDSYTEDSVRGVETWYFYGSAASKKMAGIFHAHLIKRTRQFIESQGYSIPWQSAKIVDRGLRHKTTGQFYVLRATNMTSILIESGFMNSKFDLVLMIIPAYRQAVADSVVDAICEIETSQVL